MKIEDRLDAAFLCFFFSSLPPPFFCLQSALECNVVKGQHLCLHCFSLYKPQLMKILFLPNTRLCEMNCGLCLIISLRFFFPLHKFQLVLCCRDNHPLCRVERVVVFSQAGWVSYAKQEWGGRRLFFVVRYLLNVWMSNLLPRWANTSSSYLNLSIWSYGSRNLLFLFS